jgi:AGZA family xanthine/uracil permease-like MFS transporter
MLERLFDLRAHGTNARTEVVAGVTTFLTMSYIIFVNPGMLAGAGMDFGAVMFATCAASAIATLIMGLYAKYPIALAPGMGLNAFFAFTLIPAIAVAPAPGNSPGSSQGSEPWQIALGVVFWSGVLFLLLTLLGVRERIMNAISPSLKNAIAAGIGLFLAFIGLRNAGLVESHPVTFVHMTAALTGPNLVIFATGLLVAAALLTRRSSWALLAGIAAATLTAIIYEVAPGYDIEAFAIAEGIVDAPPNPASTFFRLDLLGVFTPVIIPYVIMFLFVDLFDSLGTLIGVAERGGFVKDNQLPRAGRALSADAAGTIVGSLLGTSTITSYIESAAGVEEGGRTGLVSVVVALLFLAALFFTPVVQMVGSYPPITAPALVLVGAMMMRSVTDVDWKDASEAIPAFLILVGIPLMFSIGDGIALGFIAWPIVKLLAGRWRDLNVVMVVLAAVLLAYFVLLRAG